MFSSLHNLTFILVTRTTLTDFVCILDSVGRVTDIDDVILNFVKILH